MLCRGLLAERLDDRRLIAGPSRIARLGGGPHAARYRDHLPVHGKGAARHIILGEGDLDAFVEGIARGLFAPAHGIQIRQRRLAPQIAFSPKRERLRHHDRMPAEDVRVAVILIAVRNHRIVKRIGPGGLGCGGRGIERRRA